MIWLWVVAAIIIPVLLWALVVPHTEADRVIEPDRAARIAALECNLGLCDHAVVVLGSDHMVCAKTFPTRAVFGTPVEEANKSIARAFGVPPASYRRRPGPTNDFTRRNAERWTPPPPEPAVPPEKFER